MRTAAARRSPSWPCAGDAGVVGFDIAGAEAGYPPTRHLGAFQYVMRANFHTTIHAGEAFGLPSIWEAVQWCGAERLGRGVRIVDDITGPIGNEQLGRLAAHIRDTRIPLELCPTSNVNTGVVRSIAEHPIEMLRRLRFRVTVNTDNRLMSDTSMTNELVLQHAFGWTIDDFEWVTINTVKSVFTAFPERLRIINGVIKPRHAAQGGDRVRAVTETVTVALVDHPLVAGALAQIRDRTTPNALFRQNLERIGTLLMARATEDLPTFDTTVETPLTSAPARRLAVQPVVVPILRAGLGFVHAAQELLPAADVGFIGISRDEETFAPKPYVNKLPESLAAGDRRRPDAGDGRVAGAHDRAADGA